MKKTKKMLLCAAVAASACMMFTGCAKKQDPVVHIGVDGETIEDADVPITPMDETQPDATAVMQTVATYQYSEPMEDENGTQDKLIFIDEKGNEFQALVSEFTIVPEEMEPGTKYMVHHSRVYEIEPVDDAESLAITDDEKKESSAETTKSVETDESKTDEATVDSDESAADVVNETAAEEEAETVAESETETDVESEAAAE